MHRHTHTHTHSHTLLTHSHTYTVHGITCYEDAPKQIGSKILGTNVAVLKCLWILHFRHLENNVLCSCGILGMKRATAFL